MVKDVAFKIDRERRMYPRAVGNGKRGVMLKDEGVVVVGVKTYGHTTKKPKQKTVQRGVFAGV